MKRSKSPFTNAMASDLWREWSEGEEHQYKLEQCFYHFFMNALSVLESLRFCLYFVGALIDPNKFRNVSKPKHITLKATRTAFDAAFPQSSMTAHLMQLSKDPDFIRIDAIRNILAHGSVAGEISALLAPFIPMEHTPRQEKSFGTFQV